MVDISALEGAAVCQRETEPEAKSGAAPAPGGPAALDLAAVAAEIVEAVRFKRPLVILPASLNFVHYMRYAWPVRYYDRVLLQYF